MGVVTITGFRSFKVRLGVVISDSISVLVFWGYVSIGWGWAIGGRGRVVGNGDTGKEGKDG